jgi:hypothetical protein
MILAISHRYPRLGAILSVISNIAYLAYGVAIANRFLVITGIGWLALSIVQTVVRHRRAVTQKAGQ